MSDEPQNPIPTENSIPPSPQEPSEQAPEITPVSEPSTMPSGAPEASRNSESAIPVNNDNSTLNEPEAIPSESAVSQANPDSNGTSKAV